VRVGCLRLRATLLPLVLPLLGLGCAEPTSDVLPTPAEIEAFYPTSRDISVEMNGNVAEISVHQPFDQLERGGPLWAKVGPYIFLFSEGTRDAFERYPLLAGMRVITVAPGGAEIARATLARDELNEIGWRRAISIAGHARVEGSVRVTRIEELVRWGEEHTTFEYSPTYVP